ncbi:MAG: FKBP-type peptidyl-prolyl cis-trans isomerase [Candidatus Thiodiazotropha sp.]
MAELKPKIAPGSRVRMHFSLTLPDTTEVLSTYGGEPLEFTLGDNTMEQMLEFALLGLRGGDEQELLVSGDDVYGARDENQIHWLERNSFPADQALNPGEIMLFSAAEGDELAGVVLAVEEDLVQIDFNHPLSGKHFHYKVTILDVEEALDSDPVANDQLCR